MVLGQGALPADPGPTKKMKGNLQLRMRQTMILG
jgi:hypothetical protein